MCWCVGGQTANMAEKLVTASGYGMAVVCMLSGSRYAIVLSTSKRSVLGTPSGFRSATILSMSRHSVVFMLFEIYA